jgi:hypothetical protein
VYFPARQIGLKLEAMPSAWLVGALENTYRTTFVLDLSTDRLFYFALLHFLWNNKSQTFWHTELPTRYLYFEMKTLKIIVFLLLFFMMQFQRENKKCRKKIGEKVENYLNFHIFSFFFCRFRIQVVVPHWQTWCRCKGGVYSFPVNMAEELGAAAIVVISSSLTRPRVYFFNK